ncbi:MAG TPA: four helix bundle protein [Balneolaceae bacterium]|nr:four helix bundle protein [Balneolaceae bacterium]
MKSYTDLDIYKMAYELALEVHELTMTLSKYEQYEQGSQIRRSSKRIKDTVAEGFGRRRYKDEFIRFLIFAHSSCDETVSQLNMISDIHFKENPLTDLLNRYDILGRKINSFIKYVETSWKTNLTRNTKPAPSNPIKCI